MNQRLTVLGTAALSLMLGSLYALRAFGPTEAEVAQWGRWCLLAGVLAMAAGVIPLRFPALRLAAAIGFGLLGAAQLPPILLWILFHGRGISDGSPPSAFTAHWAWALPHALLLWGAAASARSINRGE